MTLRTVGNGPNAGNQFWGCRNYPACRGIVNLSTAPNEVSTTKGAKARNLGIATKSDNKRLPVRWHETRQRLDYDAEYVTIGSIPGLIRETFEDDEVVRKLLCDSLVLSRRGRETAEVDDHSRIVSALSLKLLQRGRMPLPTLEVERAAIRAFDLEDHTNDLNKIDGGELGWESKSGRQYSIHRGKFVSRLSQRRKFELEADFQETLLDSPHEVQMITQWVPRNLGDDAGHWITPQAPLDTLIESSTNEQHATSAGRRVDFLVHSPGTEAFVIEIDGPEHQSAIEVDRRRDSSLKRSTGMDVIRVTNEEITPGPSAKLEQIKRRFRVSRETEIHAGATTAISGNARFADFATACSVGSKIQFVIARAVDWGWLSGDVWNLKISGAGPAVTGAVHDALRMYSAYDILYGGKSRPDKCTLQTEDRKIHAWLWDEGKWSEIKDPEFGETSLSILVEPDSSPYDELVRRDVDFIIRPAFLPVEFNVDLHSDFPRTPIPSETFEVAEPALTFFLQNVFRKKRFRPGQDVAIWRTLRQEDTIVLLPTGGGKSIIYQLSGLLMPGITLVIDPIVALIEDQVDGLRRYGIERATGISSVLNQTERRAILRRAERGEFQFILMAPARLQSEEFRATVRALRSSSLINLAVIDEAHCVSEWGHDFRPAYLRLADTLREICQDQQRKAPPLLALTGTASRAVLRDMMIELGIDQSQSDNVVRPDSFDREELKFEIRREQTSRTGMDALRGVLQSLPQRFAGSSAQFFNQRGRGTSSGIVFVRTVNARHWGLMATRDAAAAATGAQVATYSGGTTPKGYEAQDWERVKRQNAQAFKKNEVPILVATKSFGMGIDKPNIRFVIHNGMPGSIESFYQEAGRAGRDQETAWCIAVTSEFDETRTNRMLNTNASLDDIRALHREGGDDWDRMDDVTSAIFFHLNSFRGVRDEIQQVANVLNQLGDLTIANRAQIHWRSQNDQQQVEFAIVRLVRAGVVADYEVDWNRKLFHADVPGFDLDRCKAKVIEHVKLAQPGRSRMFVELIESISDLSPQKSAMALVSALIEFTYDVVELTRRRAILEAVNLARNQTTDAGIRRRIIEYLQDGVHSERIDELLSDTEDNLNDWWELIENMQTAVDAGELRGLSIRALESYPDDPGLLFARASSEAMCSDRDDRFCAYTFTFGIQSSVKYRMTIEHITELMTNLYEFGETRSQVLSALLTMGLLQLDSSEEQYRSFRLQAYGYAKHSRHPEIATVGSAFALSDAIEQAEHAVGRWRNRYSDKCLRLLGIPK